MTVEIHGTIIEDINLEFDRLYREREMLVEKRLRLLEELGAISRIKASYFHVVDKRFHTQSAPIPTILVWRQATREFHQIFEDIQYDLQQIGLDIKCNWEALRALRHDERNF